MFKIITTTAEDFLKNELVENGFDFVEAQFLLGYEPTLVNGIWTWREVVKISDVVNTSAILNSNTRSAPVASRASDPSGPLSVIAR